MAVAPRLRLELDGNTVLQGDSRRPSTLRDALGGDCAALLHADPPYCLLVRRNARGQKRQPKGVKLDHSAVRRFEDLAEYRLFTERWLVSALDNLADDGHAVVWTNLLGREPIVDVATAHGMVLHGTYLWAKLGVSGNAGEQLARLYEVGLIFGRTSPIELGPGDLSPPRHFISGYDVEGEASRWQDHPNHKPFSLLEPLLRAYTAPGDRVLEPFSGSGSTAAAAVRLGRKISAVELRAQWAQVSCERLRWELAGRPEDGPLAPGLD